MPKRRRLSERRASPRPSRYLYEWSASCLICSKSYATRRAAASMARAPGDPFKISLMSTLGRCDKVMSKFDALTGRLIAVAMSRMVAATLLPSMTTCQCMANGNRSNCRWSTLDPNERIWRNCVLPKRARTTNDRDERVNNYQQSQAILAWLKNRHSKIGIHNSVLTWLRPVRQIAVAVMCVKVARGPLDDRGSTHQPNRREPKGRGEADSNK